MSYSAYDHDKLEAAENMRIERKVYFETDKADISALAGLSLEQLQTMRGESEAAEQAVFEDLQKRAAAWEEQAGKTLEIKKAIKYVRTPPVKHTSNEWEQRDPDYFVRSNTVYQMYYRINENTRYDSQKQTSVPYSWTLTWSIHTNDPNGQQRAKIAGQTRKVFADRADMEKYLNGRIKAYQHLFTELSPPVPQQYADHFKVSGHLLPGYTIEGQEPEQAQLPQQDNEQPEAAASQSAAQPESPAPEQQPQAQPEQAAQEAAAAEPRPVVPILFASKDPAEKMKEITGRLEQGIQGVFESERYRDYLNTMSKFHHYSFNNTMLIALQGGQFVRGYNQWKTDFDRHVKAEENGIKILAPAPYKVKQNVRKIDPETKKPVLDGDGKPVMEEKEITIPSYKVVSVFDVSQTEGKEMPPLTLAQPLIADVAQYEDFFKAIEKAAPFPISFEPLDGERKGGCLYDERRIVINEGMSQLQNVKTAIHEAAHAKLHDIGSDFFSEDAQDRPDRRTREVQAESIAYAVCQNFGLDVSDYSFAYLADWSSGKELTELKSSLETIHKTAKELITEIEGHFTELQKAREATEPQRDEAAPEQQPQEQPEQAAQEAAAAEPTVTVIWSESAHLQDGQTMSLSEADKLFASLDAANKDSPGYDKTKFSIDYVLNGEARNYEGRQDFGDGEGGLIEHIEKYHTRYVDNPDWDNYLLRNEGKEALEADKAEREILLHEVVPYLKLHCKLSEMEQAAQRLLTVENLSPAETALYNAMQKHVTECRGMLNRGEYNLPPVPSYEDFDPDLQTYKQHVMDEITQEAASAGMTVEEYAANGYEPYAQTQDAPVFNRLPPEKQQALSDTVKATLQMFIEADQRLYGDVTDSTLEAIAVQGYSYRDGQLEKLTAAEPEQAAQEAAAEPEQADSFTIYQLKGGDETRDYRFEPYDRLRAVGLAVDPANYEQTYTAPLESGMTLERIFERFNIDRPADFTGHSLSVSDVVVLHQNGQDTAHYVDSIGYKEVPEFLKMPEKEITPDNALTGEAIRTPRGTFRVTDMTKEQIEAAGYGFHHQSDDGKYLIMGNGTRAFAISAEPPQRENPLQAAEQTTEQNENMIDGIINNTPPEAAAPAVDTPTYYPINEAAARHANDMNSYRDYRQGSATAGYRQAVDEAAAIAKRQKERVDPMYHDKIDSLLDTYARKLADNMNKSFAIEGRVASILVAGGSNFPVRKKEKQNAARDRNMEEWRDIQGLLDKIRSTGMGGISADDPQAVQKLEKKLAGLEQLQEKMKAVNAYYRKHKTLDGCPHLSPESIEKVKAGMSNGWRVDDKPYPSWALSNNNAEIRRVKERITALTQRSETPFVGWEFDGGKVEANRQDNRLQIFFDGKPDADTRSELKSSGFRWSPSEGAWQRQLNDNAIYAADGLKCIRPITGERPTEIQRKARAAAKEQKTSVRAQLAAAKEQAQEQPKKQLDKSKSKEMEV